MALIDNIADFQLGDDADVPGRLNLLRDAVQEALVLMQTEAQGAGDKTTADALQVTLDRVAVSADRAATEQALADAIAVVTGGTATLAPTPGSIPLADANGLIDGAWLGPQRALSVALGMNNLVSAAFGQRADNPDWVYATSGHSFYDEPVPAGKYLGQFESAALAAAAPNAAVGDWYQGTGNGGLEWFELTDVEAGTEASAEIHRAGTPHPPKDEDVLLVLSRTRLALLDCSSGEPRLWRRWIEGNNRHIRVGSAATVVSYINGVIVVGSDTGLCRVDLADDFADLFTTAHYHWQDAQVADSESDSVFFVVSTQGLVNGVVNDIAVTLVADAPRDKFCNRKPSLAVATEGGVTILHPDGTVADITGSLAGAETADTWVEFCRGALYVGDREITGEAFYVVAFPTLPLADTTIATAPVRHGSTDSSYDGSAPDILGQSAAFANGYSGGGIQQRSGITWLLDNFHTPDQSLYAYKTSEYSTSLMKKPLAMLACDNDSASYSDSELLLDSDFTLGNGSWSLFTTAPATAVISGGELSIALNDYSGFPENNSQLVELVGGRFYKLLVDVTALTGMIRIGVYFGATPVAESDLLSATGVHAISFFAPQSGSHRIWAKLAASSTASATLASMSLKASVPDRSEQANHVNLFGTLTRDQLGNSGLHGLRGFRDSNYLLSETIPELTGLGDAYIAAWARGGATYSPVIQLIESSASLPTTDTHLFSLAISNGGGSGQLRMSRGGLTLTVPAEWNDTGFYHWRHLVLVSAGNELKLYLDGTLRATLDITAAAALAGTYKLLVGGGLASQTNDLWTHSLAMLSFGTAALSDREVETLYKSQRATLDHGALLTGGDEVDAIAHDELTGITWVANGNNVDGIIDGAVVESLTQASTTDALAAGNGRRLVATTSGAQVDAVSRDRLAVAPGRKTPFWIDAGTGDGTVTEFLLSELGLNIEVLRVELDGVGKHVGATRDYTLTHNGTDWIIQFAVAPPLDVEIDVQVVSL